VEDREGEIQQALHRVMTELKRRQEELMRLEVLREELLQSQHTGTFRRVMTAHELTHRSSSQRDVEESLKRIEGNIKDVTKGIERAQSRAVELQEAMESV
jgi:hypothetical protein